MQMYRLSREFADVLNKIQLYIVLYRHKNIFGCSDGKRRTLGAKR